MTIHQHLSELLADRKLKPKAEVLVRCARAAQTDGNLPSASIMQEMLELIEQRDAVWKEEHPEPSA